MSSGGRARGAECSPCALPREHTEYPTNGRRTAGGGIAVYLKLTITDTMGFWDDYIETYVFNSERSSTFTNWYRLPDEWWLGDALDPERSEALLRHLYGDSWRLGNGDGSQFVVLARDAHRLSDDEARAKPWQGTRETCYVVSATGVVTKVEPEQM